MLEQQLLQRSLCFCVVLCQAQPIDHGPVSVMRGLLHHLQRMVACDVPLLTDSLGNHGAVSYQQCWGSTEGQPAGRRACPNNNTHAESETNMSDGISAQVGWVALAHQWCAGHLHTRRCLQVWRVACSALKLPQLWRRHGAGGRRKLVLAEVVALNNCKMLCHHRLPLVELCVAEQLQKARLRTHSPCLTGPQAHLLVDCLLWQLRSNQAPACEVCFCYTSPPAHDAIE